MIGGTGLFVLTSLLLLGSILCGVITTMIGRSAGIDGWASFTWGAVFGPIGLVPIVVRSRRLNDSRSAAAAASSDW